MAFIEGHLQHWKIRSRLPGASLATVVAAILFLAHLPTAAADTPALTVSGPDSFSSSSSTTFGWSFTLTGTSTEVTQLGFFDYGDDGLANAIPVAIWTSAGTQVASATVPAGTAGTLVSGFRYVTLTTPVYLSAGSYTIGGLYTGSSSDYFLASVTTLNAASGVTYGAPRAATGNSLAFPSSDIYSGSYFNGYFGPNFEIGTAPEPRAWMALALGAGLWLFRKRGGRFVSGGAVTSVNPL